MLMPTTSCASDHSSRISFTHFKNGDGRRTWGFLVALQHLDYTTVWVFTHKPGHRVSYSIATTWMSSHILQMILPVPREEVSALSFNTSTMNMTGTVGPPRTGSRAGPKFCLVLSQGLQSHSHFHTCRPP